jgi:eukaryotic-like serine/threonine-protein kinase
VLVTHAQPAAFVDPMSTQLSVRLHSCAHLCRARATRHHEVMDSDELARELIGTIVADKYRVLDVLGAGGMGTVYLAEHVFTKRRVALKRMHPELGRSKLAAERFIRESQAPSTIGHPGIVQVLDGGSQPDGSLYIVHELLEGVSMSEAVERGSLTPSAVIQLGIELLQALAAAHAKGIIHRDIKPDNVFIAQVGSGGV